jgi:hypothetical protein
MQAGVNSFKIRSPREFPGHNIVSWPTRHLLSRPNGRVPRISKSKAEYYAGTNYYNFI